MNHFCILGAGIAGITLAKDLKDVCIVEKSKGIGGRLAARRIGNIPIEHGAQAFMHPVLNRLIPQPHLWIKSEASDLNITRSWEATHFEVINNKIILTNIQDEKIECKKLIISAPAPQAKAIIEKSGMSGNFLDKVQYKSDIQLMLLGGKDCVNDKIHKYFDVMTKNSISNNEHVFLLSMKDRYLSQFIEEDKTVIKDFFIQDNNKNATEAHVHKWKYSEVVHSISSLYQFHFMKDNIFLAGDYFSTSGILGSINSALILKDYFNK